MPKIWSYSIIVVFTLTFITVTASHNWASEKSNIPDSKNQKEKMASDKKSSICDELAKRLSTIPFKPGEIEVPELGFIKEDLYEENEKILDLIKKNYAPTQEQIEEIAYLNNTLYYYLQDVDHDGNKEIILKALVGHGCERFLYYHIDKDKSLTSLEEPPEFTKYVDLLCRKRYLGFVTLEKGTYLALIENSIKADSVLQANTTIKLYSLKDEKSRNGLGKIQINYRSRYNGKLINSTMPAFHVLEEKANKIVKNYSQPDEKPIATSLMSNPNWIYNNKEIKKTYEDIYEKGDFKGTLLINDCRSQLLDIDNDGEKELVCYIVYKEYDKNRNQMVLVKKDRSESSSYLYIDEYFHELGEQNKSLLVLDSCHEGFNEFDYKEYFPITDGKSNYIVKIGKIEVGAFRESPGFIMGVYKMTGEDVKLINCMLIEPKLVFKDVDVIDDEVEDNQ